MTNRYVTKSDSTKFNGSVGGGVKAPPAPAPAPTHRTAHAGGPSGLGRPNFHTTGGGFGLTESGGMIKYSAGQWLAFDAEDRYIGEFTTERAAADAADQQASMNETRHPEQVEELASWLHEEWRNNYAATNGGVIDGTFPPRMKDDGAGGEVDIANTTFGDLPAKWQAENRAAAQSAHLRVVRESLSANHTDFSGLIEAVSAGIHEDWLSRNGEWAPEEQKVPYAQLSEVEKEKDRVVARAALSIAAKHRYGI